MESVWVFKLGLRFLMKSISNTMLRKIVRDLRDLPEQSGTFLNI